MLSVHSKALVYLGTCLQIESSRLMVDVNSMLQPPLCLISR